MEFRTLSRSGETHYITTTYLEDDTIQIAVTRLPLNGGHAKTIIKVKPVLTKYMDMMNTISNIVELDSEMYDMVAELSNKA